jgi:6-phosphogluconolactonase
MFTRRGFLVTFPAFAASARAFASWPFHKKKPPTPRAPLRIYFGAGQGIYKARFDTERGQLSVPVLAARTARPYYLALSPPGSGHRGLYAVNSIHDPAATVTSFAIDTGTGDLKQIGQVSSGGSVPVYISIDATGHAAFVADYFGSTIASYRIEPDGRLSQPVDRIDFSDHEKFGALGPNAARQDVPHPHCTTISPDNRFLLVCDLGTDHISIFQIHPETGQLSGHTLFTNNRPGSGPRHLAFHPNGRWVYCICEIDSTIDRLLWTATRFSNTPQGMLTNTNATVKTIAPDFPAEKNTAAELAISSDGRFLYASNRGENSLVVFSIDDGDGGLTLVQRISCSGWMPNQFVLDPSAQWLLCGNQNSATVTIFRRDSATGKLSGPTQTVSLDSPMMMLFA